MITARVVFALLAALVSGVFSWRVTGDSTAVSICVMLSFTLGLLFFPFGPRRS